MKKIFTPIFLSLFFTLKLFCQADGTIDIETVKIDPEYLDSVIYYNFTSAVDSVPYEKSNYDWDENMNKTLNSKSWWDTTMNKWIVGQKDISRYNSNGDLYQYEFYKNDWGTDKLIGNTKGDISYDDNNQEILTILYNWDEELNDWIYYHKGEHFRDAEGNDTLAINYYWNKEKEIWENGFKIIDEYYGKKIQIQFSENQTTQNIYTFNIDLNSYALTEIIVADYDDAGVKISQTNTKPNSSITLFEYADGNLISENTSKLDNETGEWLESAKKEYSYDSNGNNTLRMEYSKNEEEWEETVKEEFEYDANNNIIYNAYFKMDKSTGTWKGDRRFERTYNDAGNSILYVLYEWDYYTSDWHPAYRAETTYSETDGTETTRYEWDPSANELIFSSVNRTNGIDVLDAYGNKIHYIGYSWIESTETWRENDKYEIVYDQNGNYTFILYTYDETLNDWALSEKHFYYYHPKTEKIGIQQNFISDIKIFPNPCVEQISVQGSDLHNASVLIYALNGKLQKNCTLNNGTVQLKDLQQGNYVITITQGNTLLYTQKIVKL